MFIFYNNYSFQYGEVILLSHKMTPCRWELGPETQERVQEW